MKRKAVVVVVVVVVLASSTGTQADQRRWVRHLCQLDRGRKWWVIESRHAPSHQN